MSAFGLLGDIGMAGLRGLEGLFGNGGQPQPQQAPQPQSAGVPVSGNAPAPPQPQPEGLWSRAGHFLFGGASATPNDPLAPYRPGLVQEAFGTAMMGGNPIAAHDFLTNHNIARANIARQQQFVQALAARDPAEAQAFLMDPKGYLDARYGAHQLKPGETLAIGSRPVLGAPADVAPDHSLLNPVTGQNVATAPSGPTVVAPSSTYLPGGPNPGRPFTAPPVPTVVAPSSTYIAPGQSPYTAPAEPKVITTPAGSSSDVVYPGRPNGGGATGAPRPPFDIGGVQANPTAFFSGVFGKPVAISSGARTPQHNAAVGGVPNSAHLSDQAWDIPSLGLSARDAAARLKASGVPFDQVIDEGDHLHVSLAPKARGIVLTGRNGQYQVASAGNPQPQGASGVQHIRQGAMPQQLVTPQERAAAGISLSDRAGYARMPDGKIEKTAEDDFGPERQMAYSSEALKFEPLKNYITTRGFLDAAKQSMQQKGGFADLNLIDMAGKSVNPTLAMRPNMIDQFGKERGWTDEVIGKIRSTMEHGQSLDDAARNALYNTIYTNTKAHYNAAKPVIDKVNRDAAKYHLTPQDLIPDLQEMPGAPPPAYGGNASDQAIAAAKAAIQRGAPRAAVIQRLRQNGINPVGL